MDNIFIISSVLLIGLNTKHSRDSLFIISSLSPKFSNAFFICLFPDKYNKYSKFFLDDILNLSLNAFSEK